MVLEKTDCHIPSWREKEIENSILAQIDSVGNKCVRGMGKTEHRWSEKDDEILFQ